MQLRWCGRAARHGPAKPARWVQLPPPPPGPGAGPPQQHQLGGEAAMVWQRTVNPWRPSTRAGSIPAAPTTGHPGACTRGAGRGKPMGPRTHPASGTPTRPVPRKVGRRPTRNCGTTRPLSSAAERTLGMGEAPGSIPGGGSQPTPTTRNTPGPVARQTPPHVLHAQRPTFPCSSVGRAVHC